jgi:hypothetical protein
MSSGRGGGVILPARAACGDEAAKATAAPANTIPATLKLPIVLNNFDFKFLYNISISPYLPKSAAYLRSIPPVRICSLFTLRGSLDSILTAYWDGLGCNHFGDIISYQVMLSLLHL